MWFLYALVTDMNLDFSLFNSTDKSRKNHLKTHKLHVKINNR